MFIFLTQVVITQSEPNNGLLNLWRAITAVNNCSEEPSHPLPRQIPAQTKLSENCQISF